MADEKEEQQDNNVGVQPRITALTPISEQVGTHILDALKEPDCVAILTTIVPGLPSDNIVSVPLSASQMSDVGTILGEVQQAQAPLENEVCIGFHCPLPKN